MIVNEKLLFNSDQVIKAAIRQLDISIGSLYDLQVLNAGGDEAAIDAIVKQGGKLADVNKARQDVGLWNIQPAQNVKLSKKTWSKTLKEGRGALIVVLNSRKRLKTNTLIANSIDYVKEIHAVEIDRSETDQFDSFLVYTGKTEEETNGTEKGSGNGKSKKTKKSSTAENVTAEKA